MDVDKEVNTDEKREIVEARKLKRKNQKSKKEEEHLRIPRTGQLIQFKEKGSNDWKSGRAVGGYKKTSLYKDWKHIQVGDNSVIERDFVNGVDEWKELTEDNRDYANDDIVDTYVMTEIEDEVFPVKMIPRKEYHRPKIQEAIFKSFKAFKEVKDEGQTSVPIRWVITEQKQDGKNQPYKARLCIRGDLERGKENIRSDSPTASKETLKLALIIAANEGFKVQSGDIKSAFLQGAKVERKIYVKPPIEANADGKLWLLLQGAYGILDGGRLFYLRLAEQLQHLGMHKVHSDGAFFTYVKEGKLLGLIALHVDDLMIAGNDQFQADIVSNLKKTFLFSKIEDKTFKYCGSNITANNDGSIQLDQNDYIDTLKKMDILEGPDDRALSEKEKKEVRGKIGELLWISLMTRPDLSFDVNILSSEVAHGNVKTAKCINTLLTKAQTTRNILKFRRLGNISNLVVKVFADASYCNQDSRTRSTAGRVVLIENKVKGLVNVVSWKTKKIARVCRSVKGAETRALEDALDDGVNTARLIDEIYTRKIDLKKSHANPSGGFY